MQISLKKALKVRKELEGLVKAPALPLSATLSVFVRDNLENPQGAIDAARNGLSERLDRQERLSRVLRDLRIAVARANVEADVERLLAETADLDRQIALQKIVAGAAPTASLEEVKGQAELVDKALRSEERARGYGSPASAVEVSVVSPEMREAATRRIADLRREKERLDDERVAANARMKIEIAEEDASLLRELGIL